jgi:Ca2+-binding RTX toxin-like protein
MVKFVASVGVNINQLQGLQDLLDGSYDLKGVSSSLITVKAGSITFEISGNGLGIDLSGDLHGTVTGLEASTGGNPLYEATQFSLALADLAGGGSLSDLLTNLLSGKDTLIGSNDADILRGFGGNDTVKGKGGQDTLLGDSGNDNLKGGDDKDNLKGGGGVDKLDGGSGNDKLNGGGGLDQYFFKNAPGDGVDTITNFQAGEKIKLHHADFSNIGGKGKLAADFFHQGSNAQDGNDHIIYDVDTGKIYYDADGLGGADKILFARVDIGTPLDHNDFFVI